MPTEAPEHTLTYGEHLARAILAEPRGLGVLKLVDQTDLRCVLGVVGDHRLGKAPHDTLEERRFCGKYFAYYGRHPHIDNDTFWGTATERAQYIAARVRVLV